MSLVRPYVLMNCGSAQDVEDTIQDGLYTFLTIFSKKEFTPKGQLLNYLYIICKNNWLKELERRKKLKLSGSYIVEEIEDNKWALKEKQRTEALLEIIDRNEKLLSEKCQKVIGFRRKGLTCTEIAELLHLKNSQMAKDKHYRCKKRLRDLIKQDKDYLDFINNPRFSQD